MTTQQLRSSARWALVPFAASFGFIIAMPAAWLLNRLVFDILLNSGHETGGKLLFLYVLPYDGAVAASLFIWCGSLMAPSHHRRVGPVLLVVGALLAWGFVGVIFSPFYAAKGPARDWWPIAGTYMGGLIAFAALCIKYRASVGPMGR